MPDIIIKDENGNDETYTDVSTVKFKTPGGETVSYQYNPGTDYPWKTGEIRVRWIDYDGNVLKEQWVDQGDGVTNPTFTPMHPGLTFARWNYTDAQLAELNGSVDVGAIYTPSMASAAEGHTSNIFVFRCRTGQLNVRINGYYNGANTFHIDWGDGSTEDYTVSRTSAQTYGVNWNRSHTYAADGEYTVTVTKTAGAGDYWWGYYTAGTSGSSSYNVCGGTNSANLLAFTCDQAVTKIGGYAFTGSSSLQACVLPQDAASLNGLYYAFYSCSSLQSVSIPDGVTSIGSSAFYSCFSLQSVSIPDGVTSIESSVFQNCYTLQSVSIPDGVTSIGSSAFSNCYSLQSVSIPAGVTSIGSSAFYECRSLQSVSIPDGVTSIGQNAFYQCYTLQSIVIPDGVTSIGAYAFYYCVSLRDLYLSPATPPTYGSSALYSISAAILIHVPSGSVAAYKSASGWSGWANYIVGY